MDEVLIVFHDSFYGEPLRLDAFDVPGVRFSDRPDMLPAADAVVFHVPGDRYREDPPRFKPRGQLWVAWSLESDVNYPDINDPKFDLRMTYQREADVWIPYVADYGSGLLENPATPTPPRQAGCTIASFISSAANRNNRLDYLAELSGHMEIHHYGKFMRNRHITHDSWRDTKLHVFRRYKFAVAFENSSTPDYVTEKYFDPLLTGAIPVYMGAPNISEFAPGLNCHIDTRDFANPADLAKYILALDRDDSLYERHLEWRHGPLLPAFSGLVHRVRELPHPFLRLARIVKDRAAYPENSVPGKGRGWNFCENGEDSALIHRGSGTTLKVNGSTWCVWEMIDGRKTVREITEAIKTSYPASAARIPNDVRETLRRLEYHGAVRVGERP